MISVPCALLIIRRLRRAPFRPDDQLAARRAESGGYRGSSGR
jgi:hypothetical protein